MRPRCLTCGCTDYNACITSTGECWWILVDREHGRGICSACGTVAQMVAALVHHVAATSGGAGGVTIRELSELTGASMPRVFRALDDLEGRGVVERVGRRENGADIWRRVVPS